MLILMTIDLVAGILALGTPNIEQLVAASFLKDVGIVIPSHS